MEHGDDSTHVNTYQERENRSGKSLEDVSFTCDSPLQELELLGKLSNVYVRDIVYGAYRKAVLHCKIYSNMCALCIQAILIFFLSVVAAESPIYPFVNII